MADATVFIIDDDEVCLDSTSELVRAVGLSVETFTSASAFLQAFDPARSGCLVLDVRMPGMSGLALQAHLIAIGARIPIVFVSGHGDIEMAVRVIKNGAVDFVQKPYGEQQLLDAINEALRRDSSRRAHNIDLPPDLDQKAATLTAREREVMSLSLKGLRPKAIAKELEISHRTVEQYRSQLLEKLGLASVDALLRRITDWSAK